LLPSWLLRDTDTLDLTLKHGWRTGAIIPELRKEIKIMNTPQYVHMMTWLQSLTGLIEQMQVHSDPATRAVVEEWSREREAMKPQSKKIFNPQFGSLFRTYHNPTYFSRRLSRFADIYMASISCLLNYDLKHTFFPRLTPLQHEAGESFSSNNLILPSVMSTSSVDPDTIFANNEMSLRDIEIYGFDYDYTLAFYSSHLHTLIFNIARDILISKHRYPEGLQKYEYIPDFAVRGLHYDVQKALLMKIDAFHYIQLGTVYRGLHPVPDEEVIAMYEGSHVPLEIMSDFYGKSIHGHTMKQFMDIFSLPEMTLLSCVNDFFMSHNIDYEPVHLYKDVKEAIRDVHVKGIMYRAVEADMEKYICYGEQSQAVLKKLSAHGKKMFLITNSPFDFVDRGMSYIVGKNWRDLFDAVIVQADKPSFFNDRRKPFRRVTDKGALLWDRIHRLEKGQIYKQGNLYEFLRLTGWRGSKVLYFGDHIYSDLAFSGCALEVLSRRRYVPRGLLSISIPLCSLKAESCLSSGSSANKLSKVSPL
ncbi:5'-nucleotidase domain-containing protein 3-like, partial [Nematolebias whitei]|uniref:5'-nucleotidase domain-containing protein 3-like n=1 Tax=Nematolebias whitei TaxID=451745 RepID=UPI00189A557D